MTVFVQHVSSGLLPSGAQQAGGESLRAAGFALGS